MARLAARLAQSGIDLEFVPDGRSAAHVVPADRAIERAFGGARDSRVSAYAVLVELPRGLQPAWFVVKVAQPEPGSSGRVEFTIIDAVTGHPLGLTFPPDLPALDIPPGVTVPTRSDGPWQTGP
ncbi:MAG TPA: hypothetical protein VFK38_03355 [Candidatus Limnocylindrales bacterium]|nr:hypothetical protein [Candidatus Limnocylindrales bacterium]